MTDRTPLQSWALPHLRWLTDYLSEEDMLQMISCAAALPTDAEVAEYIKACSAFRPANKPASPLSQLE